MYIENCSDTSEGATDNLGLGCSQYAIGAGMQVYCGRYNNPLFESEKMCCGCGGGISAARKK